MELSASAPSDWRCHEEDDLFAIDRSHHDVVTIGTLHADERKVNLICHDALRVQLRVPRGGFQPDSRVAPAELSNDLRGQPYVPHVEICDSQPAAIPGDMIFHLAQRAILFLHERLCVEKKGLTGRRQMHLARISLEELNPELSFQDLNPQAEGGLREVEFRGGTAEMPLVGDRNKRSYVS